MYFSKGFVAIMSVITLFFVVSLVTEETRCIARARQILREMMLPIPADIESGIGCELPSGPSLPLPAHGPNLPAPDTLVAPDAETLGLPPLRIV